MKKVLLYLFSFILLFPVLAYSFDLSLTPYSQMRVYASGDTRPLYAIGSKLMLENWPVKNLGLYSSIEWGAISEKDTTQDGNCSWWSSGEGCKQWDTWINSFRQSDPYTAVMIGIQYKIDLFKSK